MADLDIPANHVDDIRRDEFEPSPEQVRLWKLGASGPGHPFVTVAGFRLTGGIDTGELREALRRVASQHEMLRTRLRTPDASGEPVQSVADAPILTFRTDDSPEPASLRSRIEDAWRADVDPDAPALQATLYSDSPRRHHLVIRLPSTHADTASLHRFLDDLCRAYVEVRADAGADVSASRSDARAEVLQYPDVATWRSDVLDEEDLPGLRHWRRQDLDAWTASRVDVEGPGGGDRSQDPSNGDPQESRTHEASPEAPRTEADFTPRRCTATLEAVASRLDAVADRHGASRASVLQAAWTALLARLGADDPVTTGHRADLRVYDDLRRTIGPLTRTVPLQVDVAGTSFDALVTQIEHRRSQNRDWHLYFDWQTVMANGRAASDQEERGREGGRPPSFPYQFDAASAPPAQSVGDLTIRLADWIVCRDRYRLRLRCLLDSDSLRTDLHFDAARVSNKQAGWIVDRFHALLDFALHLPDTPVEHLPILPEQEQKQLRQWENGTAFDAEPGLLPDRMEQTAQAVPDRICLSATPESSRHSDSERPVHLTFSAVSAAARRMATRLRRAGVGAESVVAVFAGRSPALVTALRGIWASGAAYLPLDPDAPTSRLTAILSDSRATAALVPPHRQQVWEELEASVDADVTSVPLDLRATVRSPGGDVPAEDELPDAAPDDLAYLLFTSGSTGRPKGVEISHRSVACRIAWMQTAYPIDGPTSDRLLQKTPAGFDVSVWELFWGQVEGVTLEVPDPGVEADPARLETLIERERLTVLHFVPSMLRAFLTQRSEHSLQRSLRSLQRVVCSGEELTPSLRDRFDAEVRRAQRSDGAEPASLHNLYGPTEATVDVTRWRCRFNPEARVDDRRVPIGQPVQGVRAAVVNRNGQRVPIGVAGELVVGGPQVGRGYRGRPRQTAEQFVPDPFASARASEPGETESGRTDPSGQTGVRMYRTGDRARWTDDGTLDFLGRIDRQVQVRGVRVEPGEVEAVLEAQPGVTQAAVTTPTNKAGDRSLVGFVVAEGAAHDRPDDSSANGQVGSALHDALRDAVRTELGTAKTPQHVVVLDDVPLTESGKVDYDALPDATDGTTEHEPPDGEVEQVLATVWSDVLDVERVGRSDDFMRLGGNSITAIQVTTRIESIFGIDLGVATVLTESTVAELTCVLIERSPNPERLRKAAAVFLRVQNMSKEKRDVLLQKARADRS